MIREAKLNQSSTGTLWSSRKAAKRSYSHWTVHNKISKFCIWLYINCISFEIILKANLFNLKGVVVVY